MAVPDREARIVRWISYGLFLASALALITTLYGAAVPWVAFAAGTAIFGMVAVPLFLREERERGLARDRAATSRVSQQTPNFQISGDDSP